MAMKREEVLWSSERAAEWAVLGGRLPGGQQGPAGLALFLDSYSETACCIFILYPGSWVA